MGFKMSFEIEGDKQISAELGIAIGMMKDFSEPMADAADIMEKAVEDNFDKRGGRFGGWAPRKPTSPPQTHPLLEKTGAMRKDFYKESTSDYAMVGNSSDYFGYHQSNQPRKTALPRRVMLQIDATMRDEIMKTFQAYIVKAIRGGRT